MKRILSSAISLGLVLSPLAGCASSSKSIQAQYVSEYQYSNLNCQQIAGEMQRVSSRVKQIAGEQDDAATADAVAMGIGLVVFWPALFALALTDDQESELGRLKGEYEALERAATSKGCGSGGYSGATTTNHYQDTNSAKGGFTPNRVAGPGPAYQPD